MRNLNRLVLAFCTMFIFISCFQKEKKNNDTFNVTYEDEESYKYVITANYEVLQDSNGLIIDTIYCNDSIVVIDEKYDQTKSDTCPILTKVRYDDNSGYIESHLIYDFNIDTTYLSSNTTHMKSFLFKNREKFSFKEHHIEDYYTIVYKAIFENMSIYSVYSLLRVIHQADFMPEICNNQSTVRNEESVVVDVKVERTMPYIIKIHWKYEGGENLLELLQKNKNVELRYEMIAD